MLSDFGECEDLSLGIHDITGKAGTAGTLEFQAPEIISGIY